VILGRERALFLTQILMASFFVLVPCLVLTGTLGVWCLAVLLGLPTLRKTWRIYSQPPPESAPPGYPLWPLWYVAWAFLVTRTAGGLLVLGLLADAIYPIHL
jgi:1,4-dihydroxy-2-naphthoate octaprenyltransferase